MLRRLDPERRTRLGLAGIEAVAAAWPAPRRTGGLPLSRLGIKFVHPARTRRRFRQERRLSGCPRGARIQPHRVGYRDAPAAARQSKAAHVPRPRRGRHWSTAWASTTRGWITSSAGSSARTYRGMRGISIGKNADTAVERRRAGTTCTACEKVYAYADYVAVNVSSPEHRASARTAEAGRIAENRRRSLNALGARWRRHVEARPAGGEDRAGPGRRATRRAGREPARDSA